MSFKQAFLTSVFPSEWKKGNTAPIYKKATSKTLKILVQFLHFRFVVTFSTDLFFTKCFNLYCANNQISRDQIGFQPGYSWINKLLLSITHGIFTSFDNGLEITSAFLDISF